MCFIFYLGHLKIHSNSLYLGHTVNSLSNAWKTHLFLCTIRYFSFFPYNPSDGQLPQSFAVTCDSAFPLVLQDEKYKRILGTCRRSKTEGSPLPQSSSAQHAHLSPGQALQGHAHALLTGQKPGFQNPQSLKRESKTWDHTYSENRGKPHGECELPYCLMPDGTHRWEPLQDLHHRADPAATRTPQFWSCSSFSCSGCGLHSPVCFFSSWGRDK